MLDYGVALDLKVFDDLENGINKSPKLMDTALKLERRRFKGRIVDHFDPLPARHAGTFVWSLNKQANDRARRWWFANRNGPHVRRGRNGGLASQFELEMDVTHANGFFTITNNAEGVDYVFGSRQIPSHRLTGIPRADDAEWLTEIGDEVSARIGVLWHTVTDFSAGVR